MKKSDDITRKCIVTGELLDKSRLLRFVVTEDKLLVPDLYKKLSGKGVYVSSSYKHLKFAIEKNLFAKVLKQNGLGEAEMSFIREYYNHQKQMSSFSAINYYLSYYSYYQDLNH